MNSNQALVLVLQIESIPAPHVTINDLQVWF